MCAIETPRLLLRPLADRDAAPLFLLHQEDSFRAGIPDEVWDSEEEALEAVRFLQSRYADAPRDCGFPLVLAMQRREDGALLGHAGLSPIPEGVEVEYAVGEAFQGQGYASEALTALRDWTVSALNIRQLYGLAHPDNPASCRVLEKAGFSFLKEEERMSFGVPTRWRVYGFSADDRSQTF